MVRAVLAALTVLSLSLGAHAQNLIINDGPPNGCIVPLRASSSATIDPASGDIRVTTDQSPICGGIGGPTVQLTAAPSTVNSNESFTVSWTISPAASAACTATGGAGTTWTQTNSANFQANNGVGSRNYALTNTGAQAVNVTFTLSCTFQNGSVAPQNAVVTINGQSQTGCSGVTPPNTVVETSFEGTFGQTGQPSFPGRLNTPVTVEISPGSNRAVRFVVRAPTGTQPGPGVNDMPVSGTLNLRNEKDDFRGPFSASIKSCPGDFRNLGDGCNVSNSGFNNSLGWRVDALPGSGFCRLVVGQTYYINIVHGLPPNLSVNTCPVGVCFVGYQRQE